MKESELICALAASWRRQKGEELHVESIERLSAGASAETWKLSVRANASAQELVLQLFTGQKRFADALARMDQGRVQQIAFRAGVATPEVVLLVGPEDGLSEGFVSRYTAGQTLGKRVVADPRLSEARARLTGQCAEVIHSLAVADFPSLEHRSAHLQLQELSQAQRAFGDALPGFTVALKWLEAHVPAAPRPCVVHGDFRNGNLIVGEQGLVAVLDWEMAHLGDPIEDLAWLCLRAWRFGHGAKAVGGFGERAEFYCEYVRHGGQTPRPDAVRFWEVLGKR